MIVRVEQLTPEQRAAFEAVLGRPLESQEEFLLNPVQRPGYITPSALSEEERQQVWDRLEAYLDERAAKRPPNLRKEEEDEIILEALRSTRPNYRPID